MGMDIYEQFRAALRFILKQEKHGSAKRIQKAARIGSTTFSRISSGVGTKGRGREDTRRAIAQACGYEYQRFLDLGRSLLEKNHMAVRCILTENKIGPKREGERPISVFVNVPEGDGSAQTIQIGAGITSGKEPDLIQLFPLFVTIIED